MPESESTAEADVNSRPHLPFSVAEYRQRRARLLEKLSDIGVETVIITDPALIVWLTGYDAWSFYLPQAVIDSPSLPEPVWFGRGIDVAAVKLTSCLSEGSIEYYSDDFVQLKQSHPAKLISDLLERRNLAASVIGVDLDSYYLTPRYRDALALALPNAELRDYGNQLAMLRAVKSPAEIAVMKEAAAIADASMTVALENMHVGVRECVVAGAVANAQIAGTEEFGGFYTSSPPFLLRGARGASAHLSWGQGRFEADETAYIELLGCRHRYQVTVSRAVHFGAPPDHVKRAAEASVEALEAGRAAARPGALCQDVAEAMLSVFRRRGVEKKTRCGYGVGIAYPPTSGERTMSLHPGDRTPLQKGMTFHLHPNLSFEDWGIFITETIYVDDDGGVFFTNSPRDLIIR